jgi:hypothetical protein
MSAPRATVMLPSIGATPVPRSRSSRACSRLRRRNDNLQARERTTGHGGANAYEHRSQAGGLARCRACAHLGSALAIASLVTVFG